MSNKHTSLFILLSVFFAANATAQFGITVFYQQSNDDVYSESYPERKR